MPMKYASCLAHQSLLSRLNDFSIFFIPSNQSNRSICLFIAESLIIDDWIAIKKNVTSSIFSFGCLLIELSSYKFIFIRTFNTSRSKFHRRLLRARRSRGHRYRNAWIFPASNTCVVSRVIMVRKRRDLLNTSLRFRKTWKSRFFPRAKAFGLP